MSDNETPVAQKSGSKLIPILVGIAILLGCAGTAIGVIGFMDAEQSKNNVLGVLEHFDKKLKSIRDDVNTVTSPENGETVKVQVVREVTDIASALIQKQSDKDKSEMKEYFGIAINQVKDEMTNQDSVDELKQQFERNMNKKFNSLSLKTKTEQEQFKRQVTRSVERQIKEEMEKGLKQIQIASLNSTKQAKPKASKQVPLKRLKSFNLLLPVLKDGTVFAVDAPLKDGKENTITLTVDERFKSIHGSHKVLRVEERDSKPVLIVSGGWFIDDVREEVTEKEREAIKLAKAKKRKKKTTEEFQAKKEKAEQKVAQKEQKLIMKDWFVISPKPEEESVIVYNPRDGVMTLSMGQYVKGVGTVRNINMKTGETCFEKYCVVKK